MLVRWRSRLVLDDLSTSHRDGLLLYLCWIVGGLGLRRRWYGMRWRRRDLYRPRRHTGLPILVDVTRRRRHGWHRVFSYLIEVWMDCSEQCLIAVGDE